MEMESALQRSEANYNHFLLLQFVFDYCAVLPAGRGENI